jgi:hypothetical protein
MTEPGPEGTMRCREHPEQTLAPPLPKPRAARDENGTPGQAAGGSGRKAAGADAKPKPAATKRKAKAGTRRKASVPRTSGARRKGSGGSRARPDASDES